MYSARLELKFTLPESCTARCKTIQEISFVKTMSVGCGIVFEFVAYFNIHGRREVVDFRVNFVLNFPLASTEAITKLLDVTLLGESSELGLKLRPERGLLLSNELGANVRPTGVLRGRDGNLGRAEIPNFDLMESTKARISYYAKG